MMQTQLSHYIVDSCHLRAMVTYTAIRDWLCVRITFNDPSKSTIIVLEMPPANRNSRNSFTRCHIWLQDNLHFSWADDVTPANCWQNKNNLKTKVYQKWKIDNLPSNRLDHLRYSEPEGSANSTHIFHRFWCHSFPFPNARCALCVVRLLKYI